MCGFQVPNPSLDSADLGPTVHQADPGGYGYDLYDFDDLVFQTARDFSSLENAKSAAIVTIATLLEA
jgi:hypothetical protein